MERCPNCGSDNIGIGYYLGNGRLFADRYAYHSASSASDVAVTLCKNCGMILSQRVLRPEIFAQANRVREERLLEVLSEKGLLLCNEHPELPSLSGEGFTMENIVGLINRRQVFYTKAYDHHAVFLSVRVYFLLKRCKRKGPLNETAKRIYTEISGFDCIEKAELRERLQMSAKAFDQGLDTLLRQMKVTAVSAKKIRYNWYEYIYAADSAWESGMEAPHGTGDPRQALWTVLQKTMTDTQFEMLLR